MAAFVIASKLSYGNNWALHLRRSVLVGQCCAAPFATHVRNGSSASKTRQWLHRHTQDPYIRLRHEMNYRSRSAFKLLEITRKYRLLMDGDTVVELGAAPGGWTQVIVRRTNAHGANPTAQRKGFVIAADISTMDHLPGAKVLTGCDILSVEGHQKILDALPEDRQTVDAVCCDMAPNLTGHSYTDHLRVIRLCRAALFVACRRLSLRVATGWFVCKVFSGPHLDEFIAECERYFRRVQVVKPEASRDSSSEVYVLARHRLDDTELDTADEAADGPKTVADSQTDSMPPQ